MIECPYCSVPILALESQRKMRNDRYLEVQLTNPRLIEVLTP